MAIIIDERARAAIARRHARGQDATILLRVEVVPVRGMHQMLSVGWAPQIGPRSRVRITAGAPSPAAITAP
jgi:hypothetical protein